MLVRVFKMYSYTYVKILIYKIRPNMTSIEKFSPNTPVNILCFHFTDRSVKALYKKDRLLM